MNEKESKIKNEKKSKIKAVNIFAIVFSLLVVAFIVHGSIKKALATISQKEKQPITSTVADPVEISIETPAIKSEETVEAIAKNEKNSVSNADKVVVTVNSTEITQSQIDRRTAPQLAVLARNGQAANEEDQNKLRQNILNEIMKEQLVKEAIESEKIEVANYEINNRLSELAAKQNMTVGQLFTQAAKQRISSNQIEGQVQAGIGFEKLIAMQTDSDSLIVTEENAKKYYDENVSQFTQPQLIWASYILIGTGQRDADGKPVKANETANAEFERKAREVAKELAEGGDFEELVRAHSVCQTKNNGGD